MRTAVLGLGLVGGSLARALDGSGGDVVGHDADPAVRAAASAAGLPVAADVAAAVRGAGLVVLAAPVPVNDLLLGQVGPDALVTDVGSVKRPVVAAWERLGAAAPALVPGHPMTGAETAGWAASRADLFSGSRWVLSPGPWAAQEQWLALCRLVLGLGADVVPADPLRHDAAAAAISHAPHLVAAAVSAAAGQGAGAPLARSLAAGSFRDLTRITASPPGRTAEFCWANRDATAAALEDLAARLLAGVRVLREGDADALAALLGEGHDARGRFERARTDLEATTMTLHRDDPDWAAPLLALADAGGVVVAAGDARDSSDDETVLTVRRPA